MPPAARITDMQVCPKEEPGPVPHVSGPTTSGEPTVIIGFQPAARVRDALLCVGPGGTDSISQGEPTVIVGNKPAARLGDPTSNGGALVEGCPTVIIGSATQSFYYRVCGQGSDSLRDEGYGMEASTGHTDSHCWLIVQVRWGPLSGRKAIVLPGQTLQVGKAEAARLAIPGDAALSGMHFALTWDGERYQLRSLHGAGGTLLDEERQEEAEVHYSAWIRAGATNFLVYQEAQTPPQEPEALLPAGMRPDKARVLATLRAQKEPLQAALDAAQDARIHSSFCRSPWRSAALSYEGPQGAVMKDVAPYLVILPPESRLMEALLAKEGWKS